jgi:Family of unknown function (DUF6174)
MVMEDVMRRVLLGCVAIVILATGCDASRAGTTPAVTATPIASPTALAATPTPTVTAALPTPTTRFTLNPTEIVATLSAQSLNRLNDAERTWQASGVTNYQLRAHIAAEIYLDATMEVKVAKGQIVNSKCSSQPKSINGCSAFGPEKYTVSGLFQRIRQAVYDPDSSVSVDYDPAYGYPLSIVIESRRSTGWSETKVEDFVVLP